MLPAAAVADDDDDDGGGGNARVPHLRLLPPHRRSSLHLLPQLDSAALHLLDPRPLSTLERCSTRTENMPHSIGMTVQSAMHAHSEQYLASK